MLEIQNWKVEPYVRPVTGCAVTQSFQKKGEGYSWHIQIQSEEQRALYTEPIEVGIRVLNPGPLDFWTGWSDPVGEATAVDAGGAATAVVSFDLDGDILSWRDPLRIVPLTDRDLDCEAAGLLGGNAAVWIPCAELFQRHRVRRPRRVSVSRPVGGGLPDPQRKIIRRGGPGGRYRVGAEQPVFCCPEK